MSDEIETRTLPDGTNQVRFPEHDKANPACECLPCAIGGMMINLTADCDEKGNPTTIHPERLNMLFANVYLRLLRDIPTEYSNDVAELLLITLSELHSHRNDPDALEEALAMFQGIAANPGERQSH